MLNKSFRQIVLLALLCFPLCVSAQELPQLVTKLEKVFEQKEPKWKIERPYYQINPPVIHLKSAQGDILVYVWIMDSVDGARDVFDGHAVAFRNINGKYKKESKLPGFGDDDHFWDGGARGFTTFDFRQGSIYISVVAPSPVSAKRFGGYILEQITLQDDKKQTPAKTTR